MSTEEQEKMDAGHKKTRRVTEFFEECRDMSLMIDNMSFSNDESQSALDEIDEDTIIQFVIDEVKTGPSRASTDSMSEGASLVGCRIIAWHERYGKSEASEGMGNEEEENE